jgi:septum formation protein
MKDEDATSSAHLSSFILHPYQIWLDLVASEVEVAPLSDQAITDYVATSEPLDKAGAYGIQGLGGRLVRSVRGSYTAVVGLPLVQAHRMLSAAGVVGLHNPEHTYRRWLEQQGKEPLPWPPTLP